MSIKDLVWLSNAGGMQIDWVQAGGGNTSVKDEKKLWIKASGLTLSEMTESHGVVSVDLEAALEIMDDPKAPEDKASCDAWASDRLQKAVHSGGRPSMETYLHALLGKFVFHGHPWAVNAISQNPSQLMAFSVAFPGALHVPYETPGIHLGRTLKSAMAKHDFPKGPRVITLANHGLIVDGESAEDVFETVNRVVAWAHGRLGMGYEGDRLHDFSTRLNTTFTESFWVMRVQHHLLQTLSESVLSQLTTNPLIPDQQVFCGYQVVVMEDFSDWEPIAAYYARHGEGPKCFYCDNQLFLRAKTVKKMKEAEDVLWGCIQSLRHIDQPELLSDEESYYLGHWEAEAYRRSL